MKRLLALVVALALVGVALWVRSGRDDEAEDPAAAPEANRLVCATELADVCRGLTGVDVTVEDAGVTFDRLTTTADDDLDAWLVFDPWPAMVDAERRLVTLDPLFAEPTTALARSPLASVGPTDLGACGWRCLGDRSNAGELVLGLPDPTSGLGLLIAGAFAAGWFERPDFATNDFDPAFEDWFSTIFAGVRISASPVERLLQSQAFFDVALSSGPDAAQQLDLAAPARKAGLTLLYPEPVASVDVVLAGAPGAWAEELSAGLTEAGWGGPGAGATGLPNAGVLLALRDRL